MSKTLCFIFTSICQNKLSHVLDKSSCGSGSQSFQNVIGKPCLTSWQSANMNFSLSKQPVSKCSQNEPHGNNLIVNFLLNWWLIHKNKIVQVFVQSAYVATTVQFRDLHAYFFRKIFIWKLHFCTWVKNTNERFMALLWFFFKLWALILTNLPTVLPIQYSDRQIDLNDCHWKSGERNGGCLYSTLKLYVTVTPVG